MEIAELDQFRSQYKAAVEEWISAIRAEENLATPDHTVHAVDVWENAGLAEQQARTKAREARRVYEDGLRNVDFHF